MRATGFSAPGAPMRMRYTGMLLQDRLQGSANAAKPDQAGRGGPARGGPARGGGGDGRAAGAPPRSGKGARPPPPPPRRSLRPHHRPGQPRLLGGRRGPAGRQAVARRSGQPPAGTRSSSSTARGLLERSLADILVFLRFLATPAFPVGDPGHIFRVATTVPAVRTKGRPR